MQIPSDHTTPEQELTSLAQSYRSLAATGCGLSPTDLMRHADTLDTAALALRQLTRFADETVREKLAEAEAALEKLKAAAARLKTVS